MDVIKMLKSLYEELPSTPECTAGCNQCCGVVVMLPIEAEILGLNNCITPFNEETLKCEFSVGGRCMVYDDRPFTCRIFNTANCAPFQCPIMDKDSGLSEEEITILMNKYFALLAMCPIDHQEEMQRVVLEYGELMVEHDIRNGWYEFNPFTEEKCDNFIGLRKTEEDK